MEGMTGLCAIVLLYVLCVILVSFTIVVIL